MYTTVLEDLLAFHEQCNKAGTDTVIKLNLDTAQFVTCGGLTWDRSIAMHVTLRLLHATELVMLRSLMESN